MSISSKVINDLVKNISHKEEEPINTLYATVVSVDTDEDGELEIFVKFDDSDNVTPVNSTSSVKTGDRVTVTFENHEAIITGNISSPSVTIEETNEAAKVATNYIGFDTEGLCIADQTSSELLKNVLINSEGIDIRDGENVLAQFQSNIISLGKNSTPDDETVIDFCNNKASMRNGPLYIGDTKIRDDVFMINSKDLYLSSERSEIESTKNVTTNNIERRITSRIDLQSGAISDVAGIFAQCMNTDKNENDKKVSGINVVHSNTIDKYVELYVNSNSYLDPTTYVHLDSSVFEVAGTEEIKMNGYFGNNITFKNVLGIKGMTSDGNKTLRMLDISAADNIVIGQGGYAEEIGETRLYGNKVKIYAKVNGVGINYKPYYEKGDSFTITECRTSGFISNNKKNVNFFIPLNKPVLGNPEVDITSTAEGGLKVHQNGYRFESSNTDYVKPNNISTTLHENGITVRCSMTNADTDAINNDPCGVIFDMKITFK